MKQTVFFLNISATEYLIFKVFFFFWKLFILNTEPILCYFRGLRYSHNKMKFWNRQVHILTDLKWSSQHRSGLGMTWLAPVLPGHTLSCSNWSLRGCLTQNIFRTHILFLTSIFVWITIFCEPHFFWPKSFSRPEIFLDPKSFVLKTFWTQTLFFDLNFVSTQNFIGPKLFFDLILVQTQIFLDQNIVYTP